MFKNSKKLKMKPVDYDNGRSNKKKKIVDVSFIRSNFFVSLLLSVFFKAATKELSEE